MNRVAVLTFVALACACHKHEDATPQFQVQTSGSATAEPSAASPAPSEVASAAPAASDSAAPAASQLALLAVMGVSDGGIGSIFGKDDALGAHGNMWGDPGDGGGGGTIGLGNIGTIGHGTGTGYGTSHGRLGSGRLGSVPHLRQGTVTVNGRLPPEVVQRIVRQNFGRFRLCYENGLRSNPKLSGRVSTKFVIDAQGSVSTARDAGSTMPDATVVACVTRGFSNLSFPQPEGGIVTVVYPVIFDPPDTP